MGLEEAIRKYQDWRVKAHAIWDIYEGQPNETGASEQALERLRKKLGRPLPKDFEAFLRKHDGWDGYEYDRTLLSAKEILDDVGEESVETNMDNMDEDDADRLEGVFVVGLDNNTATILYYDRTTKGEPELVEHYVEELGRWPSLTAYFDSIATRLAETVKSELGTQATAVADWDPKVRKKKEGAYHAELARRWKKAKPVKAAAPPRPDKELASVPREATALTKDGLTTYLGFCGYMLSLPTAAEVTAAALAFRRHFPWSGKVKACAPSDEYGAVEIAPDTTDYSAFLAVQSGGHFGLRMVDDGKGKADERIFNFRGAPTSDGEPVAPFLEVLVPADTEPKAMRAFLLDLAAAVPLAHGLAGYVALPSHAKWRDHMRTLYGWCRVHWGIELALADEMIAVALHGLHGVSWLTLLDNPTAALVRDRLPRRGVRVHEREHATVLETGAGPTLGDIRVAYPKDIAALHNVLAPLMAPGIDELVHFDEHGGTRAWWRRFEDPAAFAVAPVDLLAAIQAAFKARDAEALRAALAQLVARPKAEQQSLHQKLSELAYDALAKNKKLAIPLYEHLTSVERPLVANLNNALIAVDETTGRAIADRFIARALPRGEESPDIFHNVIAIHAERRDLAAAVETLRQGAPHYTVALSKLLEDDKDFVWLRAEPAFAALHREIQKRLGIANEWAPLARNPALEKSVGEQPESATAYRQYAKWLTKAGDPRGALIEAQMAAEKAPRSKPARDALKKAMTPYLRNRLQTRYPKLAQYFKTEDFHWGVLDRIYMNGWERRHWPDALAFLSDPECLLLRTLYLNGMKVDLAALAKAVPYLQEINLSGTDVTDLSPLRGMKWLRKLYIKNTAVMDLKPIKALPALEFVNLEGSKVTNIAPLLELPRLCELWLYKTKVPKAQAERAEALIRGRAIKPGAGVTCMVYGP